MGVLKVTKDNFDSEVMQADQKVLIDFWASWCGPCKMLSPIVDEVAGEVADVKVCKVDVDKEGDLAAKFGVMSIPTLIVIEHGKVVNQSVGYIDKAQVMQLIK